MTRFNSQPVAAAPVGIGWRHAHYGELLESLPPLDFIEVHSENFFADGGAALALLHQAREHYAVSLHGVGLGLGSASGVDAWHLDRLARLVAQIDPVRVSDHACFARGVAAGKPVHAADLLPIPFNDVALSTLCANVQQVQDRIQRPLLVENLSAYIAFKSSDRPETDFLNELVQRTGCYLLVDVNNIYVNARNQQIAGNCPDPVAACIAWLDQIAPHAVRELHLAGHQDCGDIVIDDHGSLVQADVWRIYRHAQQRYGNAPALVEWDTDIPALSVLLGEAERARSLPDLPTPTPTPTPTHLELA